MIEEYKAWLTTISENNKQAIQVRIDSSKGYYIIEINPETKESYIIKDKMNDK